MNCTNFRTGVRKTEIYRGDPFKDTSGPSLNILIKLMSMVSIVMAGLTIAFV